MGEALNISPIFVYDDTAKRAICEALKWQRYHENENVSVGGAPIQEVTDDYSNNNQGKKDQDEQTSNEEKVCTQRRSAYYEQKMSTVVGEIRKFSEDKRIFATMQYHESTSKDDDDDEYVTYKQTYWTLKVDSPHSVAVKGEGMLIWFEKGSVVDFQDKLDDTEEEGKEEDKSSIFDSLEATDGRWPIGKWLDQVRFGYAHFFSAKFAEVGFRSPENIIEATELHAQFLVSHLRSSDLREHSVAIVVDALENLRAGISTIDEEGQSIIIQENMKDKWPITSWLNEIRFGYGYLISQRFAEIGFTSQDEIVRATDEHARFLVTHIRERVTHARSVELVFDELEKLRPGISLPPDNTNVQSSIEAEKSKIPVSTTLDIDSDGDSNNQNRSASDAEQNIQIGLSHPILQFLESDHFDVRVHGHELDEEEVRKLEAYDGVTFSDGISDIFFGKVGNNLPTQKNPLYVQTTECILKFSSPGRSGASFKLCAAYTGEAPILFEGSKFFRRLSWTMELIMYLMKIAICFTNSQELAFAFFCISALIMSIAYAQQLYEEDCKEHRESRRVIYERKAWQALCHEFSLGCQKRGKNLANICRNFHSKFKSRDQTNNESTGKEIVDAIEGEVLSPIRALDDTVQDDEFLPLPSNHEEIENNIDNDDDTLDARIILPPGLTLANEKFPDSATVVVSKTPFASREAAGVVDSDEYEFTIDKGSLGIELEEISSDMGKRVRVKRLIPGGQAEISGKIDVGDIIVSVNGSLVELEGISEVYELIQRTPRPLTLTLQQSDKLKSLLNTDKVEVEINSPVHSLHDVAHDDEFFPLAGDEEVLNGTNEIGNVDTRIVLPAILTNEERSNVDAADEEVLSPIRALNYVATKDKGGDVAKKNENVGISIIQPTDLPTKGENNEGDGEPLIIEVNTIQGASSVIPPEIQQSVSEAAKADVNLLQAQGTDKNGKKEKSIINTLGSRKPPNRHRRAKVRNIDTKNPKGILFAEEQAEVAEIEIRDQEPKHYSNELKDFSGGAMDAVVEDGRIDDGINAKAAAQDNATADRLATVTAEDIYANPLLRSLESDTSFDVHIDLQGWLEGIREGYGERYRALFSKAGFETTENIRDASTEQVGKLLKALRIEGTKKPTVRRIRAGIEALKLEKATSGA